ncbi:MAG TPA: hypothetical protein VHG89_00280 [Verrucomicrobiae bacterium]|nr:hypothetical protein [Verrucomicrobiae bacterium]
MSDVLKQLGSLNQNFLWASCVWSAVAFGYIVYGKRQQSWIPFLGGFVMLGVSCLAPALTMSLVCLFVMAIIYWLAKRDD